MRPAKFLLLAAIATCSIFAGCKKDKSSGPADFKYTYPIIDTTMQFISTAGGSQSWNFGDSTTSTRSNPFHTYSALGTYTVTLVVNGDDKHTIAKTVQVVRDPIYTKQMAGSRNWHHVLINYKGSDPSSTFNYSDETFPVIFVDILTVVIGQDTLTFTDSDNSKLYFHHTYYDHYPDQVSTNYDDLIYDFVNNVVILKKVVGENTTAHFIETYTSY